MKTDFKSLCLILAGMFVAGLMIVPSGYGESWCSDTETNFASATEWESAVNSDTNQAQDTATDERRGAEVFLVARADAKSSVADKRQAPSSAGHSVTMDSQQPRKSSAWSVAVVGGSAIALLLGVGIAVLAFFGQLPGRMGGQYGKTESQIDDQVRSMVLGRTVVAYAPVPGGNLKR